MNHINQETHEEPRNLRATSPVVTGSAGGGLAPGSRARSLPTDQESWPKERSREPEVTRPSVAERRRRPVKPVLAEARESGITTRSLPLPSFLYSRRAASLRRAGPSPSTFSPHRARPLASGGHAHVVLKHVFHWLSLGGGAGERRAAPLESVQAATAEVEEGEVA